MYDVWKDVLAELEQSVEKFWLDGLSFSEKDGVVTVNAKNVFYKKQWEGKFSRYIRAALEKCGVNYTDIQYTVKSVGSTKIKSREVTGGEGPERVKIVHISQHPANNVQMETGLNPRYTMENFVKGTNNELAVGIAQNVIEQPGVRYNPFFLYGGPGLGKTHLVQAIGNEILKRNPKSKILYTPISDFYSDFINSIRNNRGNEFNQKFRKLDVLIIDDFQFIVNKDKSQEEFFNIFNNLYQLNKQIIVTSDRLPRQIKTVDERLASRLTWAGAIDLQMPSFEDRCAILKSKAEWAGAEIEDAAIEYIAENVKTNIRDLESEFNRLLAVADLRGVTPLELINDGYAGTPKTTHARTMSAKQIVDKVARYYEIDPKELRGKSRMANIKNARHIAMYILSKELQLSTPKIATEVGVKDHTTVMHGIKRIEKELKLNFGMRDQIAEIKEKIYG